MHSIMPSRYYSALNILRGLEKTGIPLIGLYGDKVGIPNMADDWGIYYFVPKLALIFHVSIDRAFDLFFSGILFVSFLVAFIFFFLLYRSIMQRVVIIVGLSALAFMSWYVWDVYVFYAATILFCIPPALYFLDHKISKYYLVSFFFFAGLSIGFAHYIRTYSGIAPLLFLIVTYGYKRKWLLFLPLFVGLLIPYLFFNSLIEKRDNYAKQQALFYEGEEGHHMWHNTYGGFGFLNNPYDLVFGDFQIVKKVNSYYPEVQYPSKAYNQAAKQCIIQLIKEHPKFILITLFAKLGVIFLYLLIFANLGLLCAWWYPKPFFIELAFWSALGFNSLFAFLTIPNTIYLLGFIAVAVMYGIVSICYALDKGLSKILKTIYFFK